MRGVRLDAAAGAAYAAASGDRNPVHTDPVAARRGPFGEPILHGVHTALAALGGLAPPPGQALVGLSLDFRRPCFPGEALEVRDVAGARTLGAGGEAWVRVVPRWGAPRAPVAPAAGPVDWRRVPAPTPAALQGRARRGTWGPGPGLADLLAALDLGPALWPAARVAVVCGALCGMELPGARSLCWRVDLDLDGAPEPGPLAWEARVEAHDPRFGFVEVAGTVAGAGPVARFRQRAWVLAPPAPSAVPPPGRDLAGTRTLVVGATGGLGRAVAAAVRARGGAVAGLARDPGGLPGVRTGDATDPAALAALGSADRLVCAAGPRREGRRRGLELVLAQVAAVRVPLEVLLPRLAGGAALVICPAWDGREDVVAAGAAVAAEVAELARAHPSVRVALLRLRAADTGRWPHPAGVAALPPGAVARVAADWLAAPAAAPGVPTVLELQ